MNALAESKIEEFKAGMRGEVLLPGDSGYDEARTIWNAMIDRKPALIVQSRGVADVMRTITFSREQNVPLAVKGCGHNIAGSSVCDGGVMLDLSLMKSVRINPATRRAFVEPGVTLGDFDYEAQAFGLTTPTGINSTTGIAGLTLGGGFGWLSRKYGMTVDNLVSADVVTADGKLLHASEDENADLFWAIRGGGGNFGVVTMFEFQLHPVGPTTFSGLIVFPFAQARQVLTRYNDFVSTLPDDYNVWVVLRKAPPLPFLPEEVHGQRVVVLALFSDVDSQAAEEKFAPLRTFGDPLGEHVGAMPFAAWQQAFDPLLTPGARNYWKSHNFKELNDDVFNLLIEYTESLPTAQTEIFIALLGGEISRIKPETTAYAHRDARFVLNVHGRWDSPDEDERCISWARKFFDAATPFATGSVYVNFLTEDESNRTDAAYGPNYERLMEIKKIYDPENLFRINQNIKPSQ